MSTPKKPQPKEERQHREGSVARSIEHGGLFSPTRSEARAPLASFIGMWVPSLLLLGIYDKIVKVAGSDRFER